MANVLLGVTGGIAAYKAALLVRLLRADGHSVRCACTAAAEQFVTPLTLEVLSGSPVFGQEYLSANGSGEELHITAAEWADVVCIAPATTHTLVRLALGLGDDFLTTTMLAYSGPVVVAPAMHSEMWGKASTQEAVEKLVGRGVRIVGPAEGRLASGEVGIGRMEEPEVIASAVRRAASDGALRGKRVCITAGPTHEPIDPVRFLGNRSSGRMGFALAQAALDRGADVDLIAGPTSLPTPHGAARHDVRSALEMKAALDEVAGHADLVIMCAAVADFRPREPADQKIKRAGREEMRVELVQNPDLLLGLRDSAGAAVRVGFAAETSALETEAKAKLERKGAHFLCANDVSRGDIGFESEHNEVVVFDDRGGRTALPRAPKTEIAAQLIALFHERLREEERVEEKVEVEAGKMEEEHRDGAS